jgi:hypothetical protein
MLIPTVKVLMRSTRPALQVAMNSVGPVWDTFRVAAAETLKQASEKLEQSPERAPSTAPSTPVRKNKAI